MIRPIIFRLFVLSLLSVLSFLNAQAKNPEIKKLNSLAKGKMKGWVNYLTEPMPTIDRVSLKADSLLADLEALNIVLDSVPWGRKIPDDIFYSYVLPYRVSQEQLEYFRVHYWRELLDRVRDCPDMKCAVLRLNEWAYEKMKYEPTSRWDQSASHTIVRGIGRCEEMAILFIKACRTVGIPARDVYTPAWPFTNSNHAWVEVWVDGQWHFLGGAEMTPLNGAWFANSAGRASIIKGIVWGQPKNPPEPIEMAEKQFTVLNLTGYYGDTVGLSVVVSDSQGMPVESCNVWIGVLNYSYITPVAYRKTDKFGKANFTLGKADVFVSIGMDSFFNWCVVPLRDAKASKSVFLELKKSLPPDTSFWLRVLPPIEVEPDTTYKPPKISFITHDLVQHQLDLIPDEIIELLPDTGKTARFLKNLDNARANRNNLIAFWKKHSSIQDTILMMWDAIDTKDISLIDSIEFGKLLEFLRDVKMKFDIYRFPDSLFWDYVFSPRILWEDFGTWQDDVKKYFNRCKGNQLENIVTCIYSKIKTDIDTISDRSYFGGLMNPSQLLRARSGGKLERMTLFVAGLRVSGIPARIAWNYNAVEYYDNSEWKRVEFVTEKQVKKTPDCFVRINVDGLGGKKTEFYEHFSISQIENGKLLALTPDGEFKPDTAILCLPQGEYCAITGWRNGIGDVFVRMTRFKTYPEETASVNISVGIPPAEQISCGDLFVRKFDKLNESAFTSLHGKKLTSHTIEKGWCVIAVFDPNAESSISTANALANVKNIEVYALVTTESANSARSFISRTKLQCKLTYGDYENIKKTIGARELPSVLVFCDGKPVLWTEGLNFDIAKQIEMLMKK